MCVVSVKESVVVLVRALLKPLPEEVVHRMWEKEFCDRVLKEVDLFPPEEVRR